MAKEHTSKEIKYRLSDLGVQIGNIAIEYISNLEKQIEKMKCCGNCNKMFCNEQDKKECGYNYKHWELRV